MRIRGKGAADWDEESEAVDATVEKVEDLASFLGIVAVEKEGEGGCGGGGRDEGVHKQRIVNGSKIV